MNRLTHIAVVIGGLIFVSASAKAQSCTVAFNDHFGLQLLDPSQAYGFLSPGGGIVWYYHQCGGPASDNWLYFDENPPGGWPPGSSYGHFHIPSTDPSVDCFTTTPAYPAGVMGRTVGSTCTAVDPFTQHRSLIPHHPDAVVRVRYIPNTGEWPRYITPTTIRIIGPTPVSVLFQAANGSWWIWADLGAAYWSLSGGMPARRVYILSSTRNGSPYQVTDLGFSLGEPYRPPLYLTSLCLLCTSNQISSTRDLLSEFKGIQSSVADAGASPSLTAQTVAPKRLSDQELKELFERRRDPFPDDERNDLQQLLAEITASSGIQRQILISDYMEAISRFPPLRQAVAQRKLVDLFQHEVPSRNGQ